MARAKWDEITSTAGSGVSFAVPYPSGRDASDYLGGTDHVLIGQSFRTLYAKSNDFTLAFGASEITVTMAGGITKPEGERIGLLSTARRPTPAPRKWPCLR